MAKLTIDIPDDKIQDLLDAFAFVRQPAQGVSLAENARSQVKEYIVNIYKSYRRAMEMGSLEVQSEQDKQTTISAIESAADEITVI